MRKPKPKTISVVCTECGLPWEQHKAAKGKEPTLEECVRLLKDALTKAKASPWITQSSSGTGYFTVRGNTVFN